MSPYEPKPSYGLLVMASAEEDAVARASAGQAHAWRRLAALLRAWLHRSPG